MYNGWKKNYFSYFPDQHCAWCASEITDLNTVCFFCLLSIWSEILILTHLILYISIICIFFLCSITSMCFQWFINIIFWIHFHIHSVVHLKINNLCSLSWNQCYLIFAKIINVIMNYWILFIAFNWEVHVYQVGSIQTNPRYYEDHMPK